MVQNVTVMTCTVQQSEQCIRFSDEEGSRTEVSLKVAARSATLQDAITTAKSSGTEEFRLPFPYGILHTWIGALRNISHLPQDDVNVILECLLVCCSKMRTAMDSFVHQASALCLCQAGCTWESAWYLDCIGPTFSLGSVGAVTSCTRH